MIEIFSEGTNEAAEEVFENLPRIPFLPIQYKFNSGLKVRLRNLNSKAELKTIHDLFCSAANEGKGYGIDEFLNLAYFTEWYCPGNYIAVAEKLGSNNVVGAMLLQPHWCVRTRAGKISDSAIIIHPNHRGNKVGKEFLHLTLQIAKELGFTATLSDTLMTNLPMIAKILPELGYISIGIFPRSTFVKKHGWMDSVVIYRPFDTLQNLFDSQNVDKLAKL